MSSEAMPPTDEGSAAPGAVGSAQMAGAGLPGPAFRFVGCAVRAVFRGAESSRSCCSWPWLAVWRTGGCLRPSVCPRTTPM